MIRNSLETPQPSASALLPEKLFRVGFPNVGKIFVRKQQIHITIFNQFSFENNFFPPRADC